MKWNRNNLPVHNEHKKCESEKQINKFSCKLGTDATKMPNKGKDTISLCFVHNSTFWAAFFCSPFYVFIFTNSVSTIVSNQINKVATWNMTKPNRSHIQIRYGFGEWPNEWIQCAMSTHCRHTHTHQITIQFLFSFSSMFNLIYVLAIQIE